MSDFRKKTNSSSNPAPFVVAEPSSAAGSNSIAVDDLEQHLALYLRDRTLSDESRSTTATRRFICGTLIWLLRHRNFQFCGPYEIQDYFHYLRVGHEEPGGRWGNPRKDKPMRPISRRDYYVCLQSFFKWLLARGIITDSPMSAVPKPKASEEIKPPLSEEQILALFKAAQESICPSRDESVLAFLLDTACRVSETIAVTLGDLDLHHGRVSIIGKGDKKRMVFLRPATIAVLQKYLKVSGRNASDPNQKHIRLFLHLRTGQPVTRSGIQRVLTRLAERAGIQEGVSPHDLRRTFAVMAMRNGANQFAIQETLGHSTLEMTRRYAKLSLSDVEKQHQRYSPMEHLRLSTRDEEQNSVPQLLV